jgi:hypothetical protein
MKTHLKKNAFRLLSCVLLLAGCAGYGRVAVQEGGDAEVTIHQLISGLEDYDVYYVDGFHRCGSALVFDPKGDGRVLTSGSWEKVGTEEPLSSSLYRVRRAGATEVYLLLGPDGRRYGYLFADDRNRVYTEAVGESTLRVHVSSKPCGSAR